MSEPRTLALKPALGVWLALCFAAALIGNWQGYGGPHFAIALAAFSMLLAGQILLAAGDTLERLRARFPSALAPPLVLLGVYLIYALGTREAEWWRIGIGAAYVLAPAIVALRARRRAVGCWEDYATALLLWLPVELGWLREAFPYPGESLNQPLMALFTVNVAVATFLFVRRLEGVGYTLAWSQRWAWTIGANFLLFAAIAIPLGVAIGFIHFSPSLERLKLLPLSALAIFLFTAWPEELLFRGIFQNLFSRTLRNANSGLLVASAVFGLAHINNLGFPNWRYVLLATIAGYFYGRAWLKTGSLFASALVHTLVNLTWHTLFRTL